MRCTLGIDPGLVETGLVLLDEYGHVREAATFQAETNRKMLLQRIENLAMSVSSLVGTWKGIEKDLLIAIEHPILKKTAVTTYRMQAATMHAIQRELLLLSVEHNCTGWGMVEINPKQSKLHATGHGNADKDMMVSASPFVYEKGVRRARVQALADAYHHGRAGQQQVGSTIYIRFDEYQERFLMPSEEAK